MSNDLLTILQSNPGLVGSAVDDDTRAVAGGGNNQSKRISIEGGVFRKVVGGKEVAKIVDRHMEIVFVKMAHTPNRQYYSEAYTKGQKISPACWSSDSKVPDAEVKNPISSSCEKCPMSVKGSGQGGKGSACRISWRTAVVLPGDPNGDIMQLVIPGASCFGESKGNTRPFRPYIQYLANNNVSAGRLITKMEFDTDSSAPKLLFSPAGAVKEEDLATIQLQGKSPAAERAVKLTVYQNESQDEVTEAAPAVAEPKLREAPKKADATAPAADVADVVKKWSKK
jgi:hypothetical protein